MPVLYRDPGLVLQSGGLYCVLSEYSPPPTPNPPRLGVWMNSKRIIMLVYPDKIL